MSHYSRIIGTGGYLPAKVLANRDLEQTVDTTDEWIYTRTGIRQRHVAADDEKTSDLALQASRRALTAAGIAPADLDLIIVATTTPDMVFPSTACILQSKLGVRNCPAFDVQAVCSGFIYGITTADQFMRSGGYRNILVVGAEVYSRILDWNDRGTCVLFGDGAGAVVLRRDNAPGILSSHLHADGSYANMLSVPGTVCGGKVSGRPLLQMDGGGVFKFAVKVLDEIVEECLAANGLQKSDIDWLVPHQANIRIIQATARKLGMSMEKVVVTVDRHANTSAASIPLALDEAVRDKRIRTGQRVLMEAVGGGFAWGAVLAKW
ncbi:MAG TPA: beta-ketoacyl-ACP synthase III [Burkholderiales bacterium]|nr:beta-ketoacyl-ACP synthase III [Burkholderiales bacterium]